MKFLVIVNDAPWDGSLGLAAWRMVGAVLREQHEVVAVYFRGEGVYTALNGQERDGGAADLFAEWEALAAAGVPLLLCSTDARRRLPGAGPLPFREAGLPELVNLMSEADRVVSL